MDHLQKWEERGGKRSQGERGERNTLQQETSLICEWEGCGRSFKSKAGLTIHRKRIHEVSKLKVMFKCEPCSEEFSQEANLINHQKICTGLRAEDPTKRKCNFCMGEFKKKSFNQHYKRCKEQHQPQEQPQDQQQLEQPQARVYRSETVPCPGCGRQITKSNLSRHRREVCQGAP